MPLDSVTVGANQREILVVGDPANAGNQLTVGQSHTADAQALNSSIYSLVVGAVKMLFNGSTFDRQRSAPGTTGVPSVNTEGTKATYSFAVLDFTPAATATDIFQMIASATKDVRLLWLRVSGLATAAATNDIQLVKRSAANSGGTSANVTPAQHDANDPAPTATVQTYSVNPASLGTSAGVARAEKLNLGAAGAAGVVEWSFTTRNGKGLLLRKTTAQQLSLNWNGAAVPSGTSLCIEGEFSEE